MSYLLKVEIKEHNFDYFPYNLPLFLKPKTIEFSKPITFIVGENGSGKSTFFESLAKAVGFNVKGGNANHKFDSQEEQDVSEVLKLSWRIKSNQGFFFRAESFFDFSNYIDKLMDEDANIKVAYGNKKLTHQSHGESFLSLFANKFKNGLFILDEPEAALSPERQMSLITVLNDLTKKYNAQFIIATHSPILISAPNSILYEIEGDELIEKEYKDTKQFRLYKDFLSSPERYIKYLTE